LHPGPSRGAQANITRFKKIGRPLQPTLLQALVHHAPEAGRDEARIHPGIARRFKAGSIYIYDHIDLKELKEAYLAAIPQLGI